MSDDNPFPPKPPTPPPGEIQEDKKGETPDNKEELFHTRVMVRPETITGKPEEILGPDVTRIPGQAAPGSPPATEITIPPDPTATRVSNFQHTEILSSIPDENKTRVSAEPQTAVTTATMRSTNSAPRFSGIIKIPMIKKHPARTVHRKTGHL